jgi:hypothetical protein
LLSSSRRRCSAAADGTSSATLPGDPPHRRPCDGPSAPPSRRTPTSQAVAVTRPASLLRQPALRAWPRHQGRPDPSPPRQRHDDPGNLRAPVGPMQTSPHEQQ